MPLKPRKDRLEVAEAARVQLARLFGANSKIAAKTTRSHAEWKRDLRAVIHEIEKYVFENVETDESHQRMIFSGLRSALAALELEDFWPSYSEGITRVALCLLGNYPDHRKRRGGTKGADHYDLNQSRQLIYTQNIEQKMRTLMFEAPALGIALSVEPLEALRIFRAKFGYQASHKFFLLWYKRSYPADYANVF